MIIWGGQSCARYPRISGRQKGIDKKNLYVHNTSYYDTKAYRVQSGSCPFSFGTAVSAAGSSSSWQLPVNQIMEKHFVMGGLDKDFFCIHNTSFCDIGDGFVKYRGKHKVEADVWCGISIA
jgi:hypothetical protein